jgi:Fe-S cluster biosynthesis and repair protein YggX
MKRKIQQQKLANQRNQTKTKHHLLLEKSIFNKTGKSGWDFLDRYQTLKLNQDQINYLNNHTTPKEREAFKKRLPTKTQTNKKQKQR